LTAAQVQEGKDRAREFQAKLTQREAKSH